MTCMLLCMRSSARADTEWLGLGVGCIERGVGRAAVCACRTKDAAEKALKEMDGAPVGQWRLRVGWAHHRQDTDKAISAEAISKADPNNNNIYVGNLAPEVRASESRLPAVATLSRHQTSVV